MSQAPTYTRTTGFASDERGNVGGRSTVRTAQVDAELDAVSASINALQANQELNQRDDGEIRDGRVKIPSLSSEVLALLISYGANPRGAWTTATSYALKDLVSQGGNTYMATTPHVAGTFATDLAAGKWLLIALGATPTAASIPFTPTATIAGATIQAAIEESDSENRALSAAALNAAATLSTGLANSSDTAKGDALVAVKRTFTGAVATTQHAWHEAQEINFVADLSADRTGALDCSALFQAAVTAGNVRIPPGSYTMSWAAIGADISIPGNRKITIEKGATVTMTGGRFTAYGVDNVEWQVDGWLKSVAMRTAPYKPGWPNATEGTASAGFVERGFIEFGGTVYGGAGASGFRVHGSGTVSGDWVGTPNFSDPPTIVNRKGIAAWNAKNVSVRLLEVYGFDGEAVYAFGTSVDCVNWLFDRNYIHHTRFNGANFNAIGPNKGLSITNNRIGNCYQPIETSVGAATNNEIWDYVALGIYTGVGGGTGPIELSDNTIKGGSAGGVSIYAGFSPSSVQEVFIDNNTIIDSPTNGILLSKVARFRCSGNTVMGWGRLGVGYPINAVNCADGSIDGNTFLRPGASSSGSVVLTTTCTDVTVGINYAPTTSGAAPVQWDDRGTWTPVPTSLTVVNGTGAVSYAGTYVKHGENLYKWKIVISVTGSATTAATAGTTYFTGLPFASATPDVCHCANANIRSDGTGYVTGTTVYPPSWAAVNAQVVITGMVQT